MQRYEKYKDSGVDWIGEIPEHWECKRLGTWFTERKEKVSDKDYAPLSVTKNGVVPQLDNAAKSNDGDNRKLVKDGDFVINSRSDRKGSSGLSVLDGSVSLINIVMKPRSIDGKFSQYLLKSRAFVEEFYRNGHGIVADLWTTRFDEMKFIHISVPQIEEQQTIATFLDDKTAKIDQTIANKQKEIELLKERRQILIQKAVTKGLDDTVPLKDSGVDWIGEIPEHWEVVPGLMVYRENKTNNIGMKEDVVLSLSYGEIVIKPKEKLVGLVPESFETYQIVKPGDIIIRCMDLQNDKTSLRTGIAINNGIITNAYLNLNIINSNNSKYYYNFLHTLDTTKVIYKLGTGLRQNLSYRDFKRLPVIVPTIDEQNGIVRYIDQLKMKTSKAILLKQQEIEKLKEYKTVLIDNVVTGKVRVR
ncbi:restriction endonuclease subunit S [Chryseobacterium tructae]|uniref:Restriction endonuclease subunit S n=1 Tax=Chryseobacterium tructae TaxID=1037380 RepID=A0ABV7XTB4_9FLAO|nr:MULTISPECIES: restriction endonuclease subunit S [Chryseobacterium]MBO6183397.1 restriction endonuclease subunit S [Chryseobacterium sp.]MDN3691760.1 restriction endonuclease subunit S [Chryseobacterium tructae]